MVAVSARVKYFQRRVTDISTSANLSLSSFERMSRDRERALDEQIAQLKREVLDLDHRLRHEREKLADIELFIAGGTLGTGLLFSFPARELLRLFKIAFKTELKTRCVPPATDLSE